MLFSGQTKQNNYMKIPLINLRRQHDVIKNEIFGAITQVVTESAFIGGPYVAAFEREFASYCSASHCIGVANGTDALTIALMALGIGAGDEVITTACSFFATVEAISRAGAKPVFCDIDSCTANIDPELIEAHITPATRAIIPVHLYGQAADMDPILELARRHGSYVIEDCAQAAGALYKGKRVGSLGDIGCFSFYPSKNLGGMGDGGAIVTNSEDWALRCRILANHGGVQKHEHRVEGFNSRLDGLQAAVLSIKLCYLDEWNAQRRHLASRYTRLLAEGRLETLGCIEAAEHIYHLYAVRIENRDRVLEALREAGIGADVYYPTALPFLAPYRSRGYTPDDFPKAYRHAQTTLSLPIFPLMEPAEVEQAAERLLAILGEKNE
jgi:dTDP-4-amino-4,6-dideoxygalactose transaminase